MTVFDDDDGPVPTEFLAVTVNVYVLPVIKLLTVIGDEEPVTMTFPGVETTIYEVMGDPPVFVGAVNVTLALFVNAVARPIMGAPGIVTGMTELLEEDAGPGPTAFVAVTLNVYDVPLVNPLTVIGLDVPEELIFPGVLMTV